IERLRKQHGTPSRRVAQLPESPQTKPDASIRQLLGWLTRSSLIAQWEGLDPARRMRRDARSMRHGGNKPSGRRGTNALGADLGRGEQWARPQALGYAFLLKNSVENHRECLALPWPSFRQRALPSTTPLLGARS